jgi:hypothetical protein
MAMRIRKENEEAPWPCILWHIKYAIKNDVSRDIQGK